MQGAPRSMVYVLRSDPIQALRCSKGRRLGEHRP
nr:MAG TPA: hypothetical protein [Caudoviricetes sp.]